MKVSEQLPQGAALLVSSAASTRAVAAVEDRCGRTPGVETTEDMAHVATISARDERSAA